MDYAAVYGAYHLENWKKFSGYSLCGYEKDIALLVKQTGAKKLLDYGSGKGYQYLQRRIHDAWGGILPVCYDPGVPQLSEKPLSLSFDGVICSDVMEHLEERDVASTLNEIFGCLMPSPPSTFAFFVIACRPAKKTLPDGRNMHLTVRPSDWWRDQLNRWRRPGLTIRALFDEGQS